MIKIFLIIRLLSSFSNIHTGSAIGETLAPSLIFFSNILSNLTSRVAGIDSIAPKVLSLAASAHKSCNWYLGINASGGTSSVSSTKKKN